MFMALTAILEIYMLCTDEDLYFELKKFLGVVVAKQLLVQGTGSKAINDYIYINNSFVFSMEQGFFIAAAAIEVMRLLTFLA